MEQTLVRDGKTLKYGYTTGTCAAGAALAAATLLERGEAMDSVSLVTPKGWRVSLEVLHLTCGSDWAEAAVRKDAGDDPDVTHNHEIFTKIKRSNTGQVRFFAGEGVGMVTKPGLQISVGEAAINPVPRAMICDALKPFIEYGRGYDVTISVPGGRALAQKTFNPRLGIEGGISIIGTSGIVEPMSEEALKESLAVAINVKAAQGHSTVVFTPGNYGKEIGQVLRVREEYVVKTSNYAGFMLDRAVDAGIKEIVWIGHIGKLVKVAGGIFHTHSSMADGRMEILAAWVGAEGGSKETIAAILNSNTTEEAVDVIGDAGLTSVFSVLARRVSQRSEERTHGQIKVGTVLFTLGKGIVGMDREAERMLEAVTDETRD